MYELNETKSVDIAELVTKASKIKVETNPMIDDELGS